MATDPFEICRAQNVNPRGVTRKASLRFFGCAIQKFHFYPFPPALLSKGFSLHWNWTSSLVFLFKVSEADSREKWNTLKIVDGSVKRQRSQELGTAQFGNMGCESSDSFLQHLRASGFMPLKPFCTSRGPHVVACICCFTTMHARAGCSFASPPLRCSTNIMS